MFSQDAAAACSQSNSAASVTKTLAPASPTIPNGRTVPFPMIDPFAPAINTGTRFPRVTTQRPGRKYYGLNGGMGLFDPPDTVTSQGVTLPGTSTLDRIFADIRGILPSIPAIISASKSQPYYNPAQLTAQQQQTLYGVPLSQGQYSTAGITSVGAQTGAALGNLGDTFGAIVAQHPYLTLGVGAALVLWFMNPPRRR